MTRRLVITIVATVVATLVLAGVLTLGIAHVQSRRTTERDLRDKAEALAAAMVATDAPGRPLVQSVNRCALQVVRRALRVDGVEFVVLGPAGGLTGTLPDGVSVADLDVDALVAGRTTSGANGSLVYAAAPAVPESRPRTAVVAVVTRQASPGLASATRWFLLAALATLALGAVVAVVLGRRLSRPLRDASAAAQRVAAGELATRLPEPPPGDRDEVADLARSLNTMAASLERAKALERQFLLSVSHDLRTPLTSIRGYAEAIADGAAPDVRAAAEVIDAQAQRLERLVSDLLDLARLDARSFTLHPVVVDLRQPVTDTVRAHEPGAAQSGLVLRLAAGASPVVVRADPARLQQIVANLLENAAKFARSRIDVAVRVSADGTGPGTGIGVVTVDDDGPGIVPQDLPHVFERLYVARQRQVRSDVGSGLGLAIVDQLARQMGGAARAGAAPGGGARLEVHVPLATGPAAPPDAPPDAPPEAQPEAQPG